MEIKAVYAPPIKVKLLKNEAKVPVRQHKSDAGLDLFSSDYVMLNARSVTKVGTGIAIELPEGFHGLIMDRSSLGAKGIHVFGGVIDNGYRGEIIVCLFNASTVPVAIEPGDKIAQLIVVGIPRFTPIEVDELDNTDRGEDGFGSTGK